VAQGSIVSPAFFNIYTEPLLLELGKIITIDDLFGYADDILILCETHESLVKCIQITEDWSSNNDLIINKSKSAIVEFISRRTMKSFLPVDGKFCGYPVVAEYSYLGTWLDRKLSLATQLNHIKKKMIWSGFRLAHLIYNISLDFKRNLWQVLLPLSFEFALPLLYYESAESNKHYFNCLLRKSFRKFVGLRNSVKFSIVVKLMGYEPEKKYATTFIISQKKKWIFRKLGLLYSPKQDQNLHQHHIEPKNLYKNSP